MRMSVSIFRQSHSSLQWEADLCARTEPQAQDPILPEGQMEDLPATPIGQRKRELDPP